MMVKLFFLSICFVRVEAFSYALQEEFVADQLFQSSEHLADEILRITHSIFASSKVLHQLSCIILILKVFEDFYSFVISGGVMFRSLLDTSVYLGHTMFMCVCSNKCTVLVYCQL